MPRPDASRRARMRDPRARMTPASGEPRGPGAWMRPSATAMPAIPGIAILPLRLFLGLTFVYAAGQKLTDPGFFNPHAATYIGRQILGFSRGSPLQGLLLHAMGHAVAIGVLTILTELAIGLLVLLGLLTRPAALIGLVLNVAFFLSASWHTYPYFMGSDIVFVMCWLTLMLTGPGPFALDLVVQDRVGRALRGHVDEPIARALHRLLSGPLPAPMSIDEPIERPVRPLQLLVSRGEVLLGGATALALVALGLAPRGSTASGASSTLPAAPPSPAPGAAGSRSGSGRSPSSAGSGGAPPGVPAGARRIGNVSQLPANSAGMVNDPKTGDPAIVIHTGGSRYYAYDAVCTHAGCTVGYDPGSKLIVCPCHGAQYDPTHDARVVGGPAPTPLTRLTMSIDAKGNIYLV